MVKKLRRKFVLTTMLSLLLILTVLIGIINIVNYRQLQSDADETLDILAENGGQIEYNRSFEILFSSRYFFVKLNGSGNPTEVDVSHIAAVSSEEAVSYADRIFIQKDIKRGYLNGQYRYLLHVNDDGSYIVIFIDCAAGFYYANKLLLMTVLIMLVVLVESLEKQKRFVNDAGHELKTPLAIISANMDVIELEAGESEWTKSTKNQIKRMDELVKNLLTLSRMEEENINAVFSDVNMSPVVEDSSTYFVAVADYKKIKYNREIENDIHINGDRNSIQQLCTLLIDNAMKYAQDEGSVDVKLFGDENTRNAILEVSNTCENVPKGNLERLFDRFYRSDSSRSRKTGGYGIGLSVARAIATSHGGTIEARAEGDNLIRFIVKIPLMKKSS